MNDWLKRIVSSCIGLYIERIGAVRYVDWCGYVELSQLANATGLPQSFAMGAASNDQFIVWNIFFLLGSLSLVVAVVGLIWANWYNRSKDVARKRLDNWQDRKEIAGEIDAARQFRDYQNAVAAWNFRLLSFFGPSISVKAFTRCFQIAFVYPVICFVAVWAFADIGTLGNIQIFEACLHWTQRFATLLAIAVMALLVFAAARNEELADWIIDQLARRFPPLSILKNRMQKNAIRFFIYVVAITVAITVAIAGAGAGAGAGACAVAGAGTVVVAGAVAGAGAGAVAVAVAGALLGALVIAGAVAFAGAGAGNFAVPVTTLTFYVALPLANAVVDMLSWAATRYFLQKVAEIKQEKRRALKLLRDLFLDFGVALVCLVALAALIPFTIDLLNMAYQWVGWPVIDWPLFIRNAIVDPWGAGLFVWLMLGTTLVPTVMHLAIGLVALIAHYRGSNRRATEGFTIGTEGQTWADLGSESQGQKIAKHLVLRRLWWLPALIPVGIVIGGLTIFSIQLLSDFNVGLGHVAFCATYMWRGYCELFGYETPVATPAELMVL